VSKRAIPPRLVSRVRPARAHSRRSPISIPVPRANATRRARRR